MLLIFDKDRKKCVEAVGSSKPVSRVEGKRGYEEELAVQVVQGGEVVELNVGEELGFTIKQQGKYDTDPPLVTGAGADFTWDATSQLYRATVNYVTEALDALFDVDGVDTDDVGSLTLAIEIGWRPGGALTKWRRSENDITLILRNNYLREEDGTPAGELDPFDWLLRYGVVNPGYWTAHTGGGETSLDGIVTAGGAIPTGHVITTAVSGVLRTWQLQASTAAENEAGGLVRPDDYAVSTNERVWVKIA
jgi:hypothetical protein